MLTWILLIFAAIVVGKFASVENRDPARWGLVSGLAGFLVMQFTGIWGFAVPFLVVVGGFIALWIAKARDDDQGRGGRLIR